MLDQMQSPDPNGVVAEARELRRVDTITAGRLTRGNGCRATDHRQQ
jgi:hypothetical protein